MSEDRWHQLGELLSFGLPVTELAEDGWLRTKD